MLRMCVSYVLYPGVCFVLHVFVWQESATIGVVSSRVDSEGQDEVSSVEVAWWFNQLSYLGMSIGVLG